MSAEFPDWPAGFEAVAKTAAIAGAVNIIITLLCIWASWWALQSFRFDVFVRDPKGARAKVLLILFSVMLGHAAARFVIDYLEWSLTLKGLF